MMLAARTLPKLRCVAIDESIHAPQPVPTLSVISGADKMKR
jgi:hypothetical protein